MSPSPVTRPTSHARILLVEEQTGSRNLLTLVLSRLGYEVDAALSCREALDRLSKSPYRVVLLSGTLPDTGLVEAVRRVRDLPGASTPAVLVMDGEDPGLRAACLAVGAQGYLSRPVEIEPLLRSIRNVMAANPAEREDAPSPEPVVDLDHLAGFTDGDQELESELAELYLSTAEVYLDKLAHALSSGDPWTETAHALKGASNNLGARRVAELARRAEHADPHAEDLEALREAVEEVRRFFADRRQP